MVLRRLPSAAGDDRLIPSFAKHEPVRPLVEDAADQVFADAAAPISLEFIVQVIAGRAGGHFGDQVGSATM